jgi:hypothetical protein
MNSKTLAAAAQAEINANNIAMEDAFLEGSITLSAARQAMRSRRSKEYHMKKPKTCQRVFWHDDALACIKRDYLGIAGSPPTPLLEKEFPLMFRVSQGRSSA